MSAFDLTTEPWIPCEGLAGEHLLLSTHDVLARAHEVRAIDAESPLVTAALHRHVLAVLHRVCEGPATFAAWEAIAKIGRFSTESISAYLDRVRDRMDLFHPTHPFAQTRGLIGQFRADPIDMITVTRRSWGAARALFQHRPDAHVPTMSPAEAAQALLAYQAFDTGGLVKKPREPTSATSAPFLAGAMVLARGRTLFETLLANLLRYDPAHDLPVVGTDSDAPAWEQPPPPCSLPVAQEPKVLPKGWLDQLTWLARRLELVQDERGRVSGFVRCVGKGLHENTPLEPMIAWRQDKKRGWVAVGLRPERAFWRDANALFQSSEANATSFRCPRALGRMGEEAMRRVFPPHVRFSVDVIGVAANKSKVELVRRETLRAHAALLANHDAGAATDDAIAFAKACVSALEAALRVHGRWGVSPGDRAPEARDISNHVKALGAVEATWSALGVHFESFLQDLGELLTADEDERGAKVAFEERCIRSVHARFDEATAGGGGSPRWLKARAHATRKLRCEIATLARTSTESDKA